MTRRRCRTLLRHTDSSLHHYEWWWLARNRTHVGQRGIFRTPVAPVRADARKPERPHRVAYSFCQGLMTHGT
jgi:hypothetical protein